MFTGFCIVCSDCGHRNRPHKSPREAIRMVLTGQLAPCRGCKKVLRPRLPDRPLLRKVRAELLARGIQPIDYKAIS